MRIRTTVGTFSFLLASSLNPAYFAGCASSDAPGFQYGAAEMTTLARAAADSFELAAAGSRSRLDLDIEPTRAPTASASDTRALFASRAYACGNRKLFATASACIDESTMDVQGTFALLRVQEGKPDEVVLENEPVKGQLAVRSLILNGGVMDLTFEGGHLTLNSKDSKTFELRSFVVSGVGADGAHIVYPE